MRIMMTRWQTCLEEALQGCGVLRLCSHRRHQAPLVVRPPHSPQVRQLPNLQQNCRGSAESQRNLELSWWQRVAVSDKKDD